MNQGSHLVLGGSSAPPHCPQMARVGFPAQGRETPQQHLERLASCPVNALAKLTEGHPLQLAPGSCHLSFLFRDNEHQRPRMMLWILPSTLP